MADDRLRDLAGHLEDVYFNHQIGTGPGFEQGQTQFDFVAFEISPDCPEGQLVKRCLPVDRNCQGLYPAGL